jgi:hypothetical protein
MGVMGGEEGAEEMEEASEGASEDGEVRLVEAEDDVAEGVGDRVA